MLSIIIVNYKTWRHIGRGLDSLLPTLPQGPAIEIVVVDNHSNDGEFDAFSKKYPNVKTILSQGNYGYAHGCNQGALHAKGDWYLFMNPDVIAEWKDLNLLWQAGIDNRDYGVLTAPQFSSKGKLQKAFGSFPSQSTASPIKRAILRRLHPDRYPDPRRPLNQIRGMVDVDWVSGSLLLISRDVFKQVGGWDEDYWLFCEDVDICKRTHVSGYKVGYFPNAIFTHTHGAATRVDSDTRILTRSETVISKLVYISKHLPDKEANTLKSHYRRLNARMLFVYTILNFICFGRSHAIKMRLKIQKKLRSYFREAERKGSYLSERSINYNRAY